MRVTQLAGLKPKTKLAHISGATAVVLTAAIPSRNHGWRAQIASTQNTAPQYITPLNCSEWRILT